MDAPNERGTYRFIEHTADFGIEVEAPDVESALSALMLAWADLLTDAPESVHGVEQRAVSVDGVDAADTVVNLLAELLYWFESVAFLACDIRVHEVSGTRIRGTVLGERFDAHRHAIARPVKAVTHHEAVFEERDDGTVLIRLIVDL